MHTHKPNQTIVSLPLCKLYPHPGNPNRISKAMFAKLVRHLERTAQYEPIVVRRHPLKENAWQILNGHHRARALKQLGYSFVDCVVFDADDEQARLYLLSLNRLCGRDNVYKKAKLIEQLCRSHTSRELAKLLGDSKTAIEKLNALSQNQPLPKTADKKAALLPMTFFVTEDQHALLAKAFEKAGQTQSPAQRSGRRTGALVQIAQDFLATTKAWSGSDMIAITQCCTQTIGHQKHGTEVT